MTLVDIEPFIKNGYVLSKYGESGQYIGNMSLADVPVVDAKIVKYGHWIGQPLCGNADCRCSECRKIFNVHVTLSGKSEQKYCPHCGAFMDGDKENETD